MKFSFELSGAAPKTRTGAAIQSPKVQPDHAAILREVMAANRQMKRMYDSAMTSNLNADFHCTSGSANAEILNSLYISRGRARTLAKDHPTAKGILRTFKNNVVGDDPFRLEMKLGTYDADGKLKLEKDTNRKIEAWWKDAGLPENCTSRKDMSRLELYHIVEASALRDGSILARHHRGFPANKYGYAIELIESDRLQESYAGRAPDTGNPIRFSIERHPEFDFPVAYWVLTRHPGDAFGSRVPALSGGKDRWRLRLPAEEVIHFNNLRDRAEQDIGFTELDCIIQHLHRDRQFDISHVTCAIWASTKPYFMVRDFPTGIPYTGEGMSQYMNAGGEPGEGGDAGGNANKYTMVEPATAEVLPFGMKPMLIDPKFPNEAAVGFKKSNLQATSVGSGLAYSNVSGDFEGYSFSTARAGELPQRDYFKVRQAHLCMNFVRRHFNEALKYALLSGALDIPFSRYEEIKAAACFHAKRWPYINPLQDAQTDILLLGAGLKSQQQIVSESEQGGDVCEILSEIAEFQEEAEKHDLHFAAGAQEPGLEEPGLDGAAAPPARTGGKNVMNKK